MCFFTCCCQTMAVGTCAVTTSVNTIVRTWRREASSAPAGRATSPGPQKNTPVKVNKTVSQLCTHPGNKLFQLRPSGGPISLSTHTSTFRNSHNCTGYSWTSWTILHYLAVALYCSCRLHIIVAAFLLLCVCVCISNFVVLYNDNKDF